MSDKLVEESLDAIDAVYKRYKPWEPRLEPSKRKSGQWGTEPQYIPLGKEEDFRSQVFANLVLRNKSLVQKTNYTCILHSEFGKGWINGVKNSREELDIAFVDLNSIRHGPPFQEGIREERCRFSRLLGAIEIKRNLEPRAYPAVKKDLKKLLDVADAIGKKRFWGILALATFWYWKKEKGVRGPSPIRRTQFEELLGKLANARKNHYQIYFRAYHWYKSREERAPVILTERDDVNALDF